MKEGKAWYKKRSNWLIAIASIILIPILIINLWIIIQAKTNSGEIPSFFGIKPFIVLSGSMEDEIYKGDLIITKIVDPETVEIGDVIAFRDEENTVTTHRIIDAVTKNGERYFITKGDNNKVQDRNLVELSDIEGIYLFRIPAVGTLMNTLAKPTTFIILIVGITVLFFIGFNISNKKIAAKEREEFLEYKKMKEEMAKAAENDDAASKEVKASTKKSTKKKTASKK